MLLRTMVLDAVIDYFFLIIKSRNIINKVNNPLNLNLLIHIQYKH
jgi:hypothetical protein